MRRDRATKLLGIGCLAWLAAAGMTACSSSSGSGTGKGGAGGSGAKDGGTGGGGAGGGGGGGSGGSSTDAHQDMQSIEVTPDAPLCTPSVATQPSHAVIADFNDMTDSTFGLLGI